MIKMHIYTSAKQMFVCLSIGLSVCVSVCTKYVFLSKSWQDINQLPNDKILDWSELKQIADDILKCI